MSGWPGCALEPERQAAARLRQRLAAVARGEQPPELYIRGGTVVNVYSGELLPADVAVAGGRIAYVGRGEKPVGPETLLVDASGQFVAPGWIEAHAHPWVMYNPVSMAEGVLPGGTTLVFNDDLFFFLAGGARGFTSMLEQLQELPIRYLWLVRLVSQAAWTGEPVAFAPEEVIPLLRRPDVAGSAEVTRWPAVWGGDARLLEEMAWARSLGKRSDGHTAGASYEKLNAVAAAGVSACHEAITADEVLDRLRLGLWTMLRHSSLRPDVPELVRAVTERGADTRRLMLTVDGPAPRFIASGGFIDEALRQAVAAGVPAVQAMQMVTVNPATYFRLDEHVGGIAPGRLADILLLPDLAGFRPSRVFVGGREVARGGELVARLPEVDWPRTGLGPRFAPHLPAGCVELYRAWSREETLPVIEFISNAITRPGGWQGWTAGGGVPEELLLGSLLDRGGRWLARGWLRSFAPRLRALATTYNTTTQLLVLGRDAQAMAWAAGRVVALGGGLAVAGVDGERWEFALPIAGMMSERPFAEVVAAQRALDRHLQEAGFPYGDLLYALLFLTCDFLPGWRLTPRGVYDVKKDELVRPAETPPPLR